MMKMMLMTAVLVVGGASAALAQYSGPSDVQNPVDRKYQPMTVQQILADPKDDMDVVLEGTIIRHERSEVYVFQDQTGEINVEIDEDDIPSSRFDDTTPVRILGEVDTHRSRKTDIDVDRVEILR